MGEMVRCAICPNEFYVQASKLGLRKTCSVQCAAEYARRTAEEGRLYKTCAVCGEPFPVKPSHYERRKTCGKSCAVAYQKANGTGLAKQGVKRGPKADPAKSTTHICAWCGKPFIRFKCMPGKFCSRSCHSSANGSVRFGEKNSNWKGGHSFAPYPVVFNAELKRRIKERDGYQCLYCKRTEAEELAEKGRRLAIHHIDYNKQNCSPLNLMTACLICNTRFNSNREYWQQFLPSLIVGS